VKDVHESGVTCAHITVGAVGTTAPDTAFMDTVRGIAFWEREIERHSEVLGRVRVAGDVAKAKKQKRCGLIYGVQDGVAFGGGECSCLRNKRGAMETASGHAGGSYPDALRAQRREKGRPQRGPDGLRPASGKCDRCSA